MNTNTSPKFAPGQIVKYATPVNAGEASERFEVLEYLGPRPEIGDTRPARVRVRDVCDLPLPGVCTYDADEMTLA